MDTALPTSIEAYLQEAGFSGTEIVVLRRLLEEDALTLRELAAKTGKSTGVLDQAVKKLLKKRILTREIINDTPKYVLKSLQTVVSWMEEDMALKQEMLKRKHENFESFVRSLTVGKKRPEMEYFEGITGIKQAYMQLLDRGNDIIQYGPIVWAINEDPLRDFWVEYFRERRRRGIFSRVITQDTPLGRRFQSRDIFEYRKTVLVEPESYPFNFEKVIIGDTVACFQLEDERACFIKYAELAQSERIFFERLWNKKVASETADTEAAAKADEQAFKQSVNPQPTSAPLSTKTLSQVRNFFLSRASILTFVGLGFLSALITYGLYRHDVSISTQRIQEQIRSIAATAAPQFDAADLEQIHTLQDAAKPEYKKLVYQLNVVRNQNPGVKYVYLMRPKSGTIWEFIADADAIEPRRELDENGNGIIDPQEESTYPGLQYETYDTITVEDEPVHVALEKPIALDPYIDQWGELMSGMAPIKDLNGKTVGVIGIDVEVDTIYEQINTNFTPILYFLGLLLLFIFIRLAAFNRSLFKDMCTIIQSRSMHIWFISLTLISIAVTFGLYQYSVALNTKRIQEKALSIAATSALQFDTNDLNKLHTIDDITKPEYKKVIDLLNNIRRQNPGVKYSYIMRPTDDPNTWEFVADADSLDPYAEKDVNGDGVIDDADHLSPPGEQYDITGQQIENEMNIPVADPEPVTDQWGTWIAGQAPIKDEKGKTVALIGIDMDANDIFQLTTQSFVPIYFFVGFLLLFIFVRLLSFNELLLVMMWSFIRRRQVLLWLLILSIVGLGMTYGMYRYTLHLKIDETGKRLMAIAATAAPTINAEDLEPLRFARDMKREEYQRVFRQLNEIRDKNSDVTFVYIWRPTETEGMWEFVVDADSNYFIPPYFGDYNKDNSFSEADENVAPGVRYNISFSAPLIERMGLHKPVYEPNYVSDQWGMFMTGASPVFDSTNKAVAVLALDTEISELELVCWNDYKSYIYFLTGISLVILSGVLIKYFLN